MTVEQSPLPVRTAQAQRNREDSLSLTYAKVREVTGAPDDVIEEAIKACIRTDGTYKVEDVVTTIIADDSVIRQNRSKVTQHQSSYTNTEGVDGKAGTAAKQDNSSMSGGKRSSSSTSASTSKAVGADNEFIDLTRDPQGILGGQVSREEQDISRVLEQSLAESKGGAKRRRGELWFTDPLNPHERKRQEGWPVGLKNVGNTCWFSAVIQSLFHLRRFRELVLTFKNPEDSPAERRNLRFMSELKQLFGLLVGSTRKYVDPSKAVDILKEVSSSTVADGQQDVSEFQHKLLDWLEDAFATSSVSPESGDSSENPVRQLFQGKYKAEGVNEGKVFNQEVTFGQYPLNVVGFRDIHESLEATTAQGEIETLSGDTGQKSGQEIWFTHLPVVMTFELSRFGFNPQLNQTEKIHQPLCFPEIIYVDRYLECNKSQTRQKREEARKLKEELSALQARLDKFMNYGSSSKRYPLPDVLQYALEFAQSSPPTQATPTTPATPHHSSEVDMDSSPVPQQPSSSSSRLESSPVLIPSQDVSMVSSESPTPSPSKLVTSMTPAMAQTTSPTSPAPVGLSSPSKLTLLCAQMAANTNTATTPPSFARNQKMESSPASSGLASLSSRNAAGSVVFGTKSPTLPHPREVSGAELRVLQDCLRRWRTEVETDVRELQKNIASLETKLGEMYSDSSMKKSPYHLHAVLVHEGQAVSGHYWAFVYDQRRGTWLKFNDITVSHSSWDEVQKDSLGGFHTASAYCLMYVDRNRLEGYEDKTNCNKDTCSRSPSTVAAKVGRDTSGSYETLSSLPEELHLMVESDNQHFFQELASWDHKQKAKATPAQTTSCQANTATVSTMTSSSSNTTTPPPSNISASPPSSSMSTGPSKWTPSKGKGRSYQVDPDVVVTGEQRPGETMIMRPMNPALARLADQHAQLSMQATLAAVRDVQRSLGVNASPQEIMDKAMEKELYRLRNVVTALHAKLPMEDSRMTHPVLYLLYSGADMNTTKVVMSEQFSMCALLDTVCSGVRQRAQDLYTRLYRNLSEEGVQFYEYWHCRFSHYRQAVSRFMMGVDAYCLERYQEALPYLSQAWLHNLEPHWDVPSARRKGVIHPSLLAYFRRKSLVKLNELTMKMFECDSDMTDALTVMSLQILPSLSHVLTSNIKEDVETAEEIREKWCQFLEKDLVAEKIERLQDFLSKMFEGGTASVEEAKPVRASELTLDLYDQYTKTMRKAKANGHLDQWLVHS